MFFFFSGEMSPTSFSTKHAALHTASHITAFNTYEYWIYDKPYYKQIHTYIILILYFGFLYFIYKFVNIRPAVSLVTSRDSVVVGLWSGHICRLKPAQDVNFKKKKLKTISGPM